MSGLLRIPQSGFVFGGGGGSGGGSGNTGIPLGPFANWAALPVSAETGALATVTSIGPGNATGVAVWTGAAWQLYSGIFDTVADMNAFAQPIQVGAIAGVEASGDDNENAVRYQYDGAAWARSAALSSGYTWTITSVFDFSPVGLRDGDFGVILASSGPVLLRYKAACTVAASAGGGTRAAWISPEAYAATPVIQGFLIGSEDQTARAAQGWTDVLSAGGTRSITGDESGSGETVLAGAFSGGNIGTAQLACGVGAVTAGTKIWWGATLRGSTATDSEISVRFAGDGANFNWLQQGSAGLLRLTNGGGSAIDADAVPGGTGTALPGVSSTPDLFFGVDTGSAGVSRVSRAGAPYTAARRPAGASVHNNALRFSAQGYTSSGSSSGTLRVSRVVVVSY